MKSQGGSRWSDIYEKISVTKISITKISVTKICITKISVTKIVLSDIRGWVQVVRYL